MTQPVDIRPADLTIVQKILRDFLPSAARVWVFGSRATWTTKDSSDLDLAIDAGLPLTRKEENALQNAFEDSDLPYRVDVVDMHRVGDSFKAIIERDKVPLPKTTPETKFKETEIGPIPKEWEYWHYLKNEFWPVSSMTEQKQIAEILSSLDDKIELNRQINANLEKLASALFKRWFVNFEFPDANGNPHKSSGGKMVESELGEIPEIHSKFHELIDPIYQQMLITVQEIESLSKMRDSLLPRLMSGRIRVKYE